jgi:hypothetical protein
VNTLVLALYAEGRTDERFLPIVIQRTAERILAQSGLQVVDVPAPLVLDGSIYRRYPGRAERILEAARLARGYHALVIHADADYPTPERAMIERIKPGLILVRGSEETVCEQVVPIVPVQMTEAWMLVDSRAVCEVIGTSVDDQLLGLPQSARQVESDNDPKSTLSQVVRNALADRPRRRRRLDVGTLYEPLARQIRLELLSMVPSYARFVCDLTEVLVDLHMVTSEDKD